MLSGCSHEVILGWDVLSVTDAFIDCGRATLSLGIEDGVYDDEDDDRYSPIKCRALNTTIPAGMLVVLEMVGDRPCGENVLLEPVFRTLLSRGVTVPYCVVDFHSNSAEVPIWNSTNSDILVPLNMVVATETISADFNVIANDTTSVPRQVVGDESLFQTIDADLDEAKKQRIFDLLKIYRHFFISNRDH